MQHYSMLIGGDWVDSDDRFEIRSPATEDVVATVAKGGLEHADRAVAAAKAAHEDGRWRRTPPEGRATVLDAIAGRLGERLNDLAVLEARENAVHDKFVERLIERARTIKVGDPLDPATDLGQVISAVARDRILNYIETGQTEGRPETLESWRWNLMS